MLDARIQQLTAQFAQAPTLEVGDNLCFLTNEYQATRPLEFSATHLRVAEFCLQEGHWEKAEELLSRLVRSPPSPLREGDLPMMLADRAAAGVLLGRLCLSQHDPERARDFARSAEHLLAQLGDPRRQQALALLAEVDPAPPPEEAQEWQVGDVIEDLYEVTALLGQGGMGRVYRVRHRAWNAELAVKSAHPQLLATPRGAQSFVREAETWVGLGYHPHLVSCYYVRTLGGVPRIFAEYVEGGTLREWIERRELREVPRILDVAIQVAWGLAYAHERGLVHQDVKSDNVLLTPDGTARVADFGLARAAQEGQVANAGMTPAYCSPEQSRGESLTDRTDVWSWGVVVLEMLAGEVTWMSGVAAPDVLETLEAPRALRRLLERCFAESPRQRPAMGEVAAELVDLFAGYPRTRPEAARLGADSWNNHALSYLDLGQRARAEEAFRKALEADPRHLQANYNQGLLLWRAGRLTDTDVLARLEPLQGGGGAPGEVDLLLGLVHRERGAAEEARLCLDRAERLQPHDAEVKRARAEANVSAEALYVLEQPDEPHPIKAVALSASSRLVLASTSRGTLVVWDASSGRRLREVRVHNFAIEAVSMQRDGGRAVAASLGYGLGPFEPRAGEVELDFHHPLQVNSVCLAPDGRTMLTTCSDGHVRLWDVEEGECLQVLRGHEAYTWAAVFTPEGQYALSGGADRTLRLWNLEDGSCDWVATTEGGITALAAGAQLALVVEGTQHIGVWDLYDERQVERWSGHTSRVHCVAMTRNSRRAISGDQGGHVRVWDVELGRCLRTFIGHRGPVREVDIDGDLAVSGGDDGTVRLWRLPTPLAAPWRLARVRSSAEQVRLEEEVASRLREAEAALRQGDVALALEGALRARAVEGFENTPAVLELWGRLTARCRRVRPRHLRLVRKVRAKTAILSVECAPDGSWVVGSDAQGELHWLDRPSTVPQPGNSVHSLRRSADGRLLSVAVYRGDVLLLDPSTGEVKTRLTPKNDVRSVALSPDATRLLVDKEIYDVAAGRRWVKLRGHYDDVCATAWSPDGRWLATGARDHCVRIWDAEGPCRQVWANHPEFVDSLAFRPDSATLLAAAGGSLEEWDLATATSRSWEPLVEPAKAVAWESGGEFAVSGGDDSLVRLWDARTGRCVLAQAEHTDIVTAVQWSADGRLVVSGGFAGELLVWEVDWELAPPEPQRARGPGVTACECLQGSWPISVHRPDVRPRVVAALDQYVAAVGYQDGQLELWDLTRNGTVPLEGHTDRISALCSNADGTRLLSASFDGTLRLWDVRAHRCLRVLEGHKKPILAASLSADGVRVVSGGEDQTMRLWQADTGEGKVVARTNDILHNLHFFPNGRHAFGSTRVGQLAVWDTWTGEVARSLENLGPGGGFIRDCALSPDGSRAVSCVGEAISVWDPSSGRRLGTWRGHVEEITCLAFTLDGRYLLSGSLDGTVRVWEVASGRSVQTLRGHNGPVWEVSRGTTESNFWTTGTDALQGRIGQRVGPADAVRAWVLAVTPPHDLYELLGVPRLCTPEQLREAYEQRLREAPAELHRRLRHAYQTLAEPASREDYLAVADSDVLREARVLMQAEEYAQAVDVLKQAPESPGATLQLGLAYRMLDQHEQAIQALNRLDTPLAAYHGAMARIAQGRELEQARQLLHQAARAEPTNSLPLVGLAQLCQAEYKYDEALEWVEKAVAADGRLDFQDFEALCLACTVHLSRHNWRGVDGTLARIERLAREPHERQDAAWHLARLAVYRAGLDDLQGALQLATSARKLAGPQPEFEGLVKLIDVCLGLTQELEDLPESAPLARQILRRELRHQLAPITSNRLDESWSDWLAGFSAADRQAAAAQLAECPTFKAVNPDVLSRL